MWSTPAARRFFNSFSRVAKLTACDMRLQEQCDKAIDEYMKRGRIVGQINEPNTGVANSKKDDGTEDFLEFAMSEDEDSD